MCLVLLKRSRHLHGPVLSTPTLGHNLGTYTQTPSLGPDTQTPGYLEAGPHIRGRMTSGSQLGHGAGCRRMHFELSFTVIWCKGQAQGVRLLSRMCVRRVLDPPLRFNAAAQAICPDDFSSINALLRPGAWGEGLKASDAKGTEPALAAGCMVEGLME